LEFHAPCPARENLYHRGIPSTVEVPVVIRDHRLPVTLLVPVASLLLLLAAGCSVDTPPLELGFPPTVAEGQTPDVIITLPETVDADVTVHIESSDPSFLASPPSAVVPAGQRQVTVTATAAENGYIDFDRTLSLTISSAGYASAQSGFLLTDNEPKVLLVTLPATVPEGGAAGVGTVALQGGALSRTGFDIVLESSDPSAITVPGSVHIDPGASVADFDVFPQQDANSTDETVEVTASHPQLVTGLDSTLAVDDD
jgi:hypothetical protein